MFAARENLAESVQLCATACSQGRRLKAWELTAVLAYFQSLQLKIGDVSLAQNETDLLNKTDKNAAEKTATLAMLRTKYPLRSPATFAERPADKRKGYGLTGNPAHGKQIYDFSCRHCHRPNGVSMVILDNSKLVLRDLRDNMFKNDPFSLYEIIPYGTKPHDGHLPYMPMYPKEKMSAQQVEDLRAYIELASK